MAENCENFKRPRQLGLSIYTSDVSLYDGANLDCVPIPDNASLNDVIEAFGEQFCSLIELINNIEVTAPNDPWVSIMNNGTGISGIVGSGAVTVFNDITVNVAYKVISEDAVIVKCKTLLDVTLDGDTTRELDYRFTLSNLTTSNWFTGTKMFQSIFPDSLDIQAESFAVPVSIVALGGEGYDTLNHDDYDSQGRAFCSNGIFFVQHAAPKVASAGTYLFELEWEMTCQLENV